jgi:hypothetical protein
MPWVGSPQLVVSSPLVNFVTAERMIYCAPGHLGGPRVLAAVAEVPAALIAS